VIYPEGFVVAHVSVSFCGPSDQGRWTVRKCQNGFGHGLCVFGHLYYGPSEALAWIVLTPRGGQSIPVGRIVRP
jgi:hypothetical protein